MTKPKKEPENQVTPEQAAEMLELSAQRKAQCLRDLRKQRLKGEDGLCDTCRKWAWPNKLTET